MRIKLGIPLTLFQISNAVGGSILSNENARIEYITTDSRNAFRDDLFIPISGEKYNGADFICEAKAKGCFAISPVLGLGDIFLADCSRALLDLASFYNKILPYILYRIGITGSVGKTTTKEFLKILLSTEFKAHANEGNYNNEIGLPLSILSAPIDTEILIMEMGMSHSGEISRLSECLCPDIGIITKIGSAHIGNLGSREAIAKAKLEIKDGMTDGKLLIPSTEGLLSQVENALTISLTNENSNYYIKSEDDTVSIFKNGSFLCNAAFALKEKHHRECLLFAVGAASELGASPEGLSKGISSISTDNTRQRIFFYKNRIFIADFYNASAESVIASIESIIDENSYERKSLLLGDILELGNLSEEIHYAVGKSIHPKDFCNLFLFGNMSDALIKGARENGFPENRIHTNGNLSHPDITARQIEMHCHPMESILMKASRKIRLERILNYFKD